MPVDGTISDMIDISGRHRALDEGMNCLQLLAYFPSQIIRVQVQLTLCDRDAIAAIISSSGRSSPATPARLGRATCGAQHDMRSDAANPIYNLTIAVIGANSDKAFRYARMPMCMI